MKRATGVYASATLRTEARFPSIQPGDGHYESFYLKAAAPEGGRSVWIRHTVHKRPDEPFTGAVWMTYFDADRGRPVAAKRQVGSDRVSIPRDAYIRVGDSEIAPGRMQGGIEGGGVDASWNLRFTDHSDALHHFPSSWMYERRLPKTKLLSPHPNVTFDGILQVGDERIPIEEWPGMVGHNWGAEHAESWVWIHAATRREDGSRGYVDLAAGRVRIGPAVTPWVLNGQILDREEEYRVGGFKRIGRTKLNAGPTRCSFAVPGSGFTVRGTVSAARESVAAWVYADPQGPEHHALNSSIADLDLTIERRRGTPIEIKVEKAATYELGTRRTDHGIPIEPFPDG
jgi:hypothetical protein